MEEKRPFYRGKIHLAAFYITISKSILYIFTWLLIKGNKAILIYLISQLILFGVSSTYHTTTWKNPKLEHIVRLIDHISIFILISGTQTSIVLSLLPYNNVTRSIIIASWSITIIGTVKIIFYRHLNHLFDTGVYILHGLSVLPFFNLINSSVSTVDLVLIIMGGIIYVIGGSVYGYRRPDPYPFIFGYHEVFHLTTVLANYCFFIPIFKQYVSSLREAM
ncbi:hemolysin III-like putative integral membrane protein [Vairimorpha necatrix]|uniref:Hemolysin III-like putative integral membrane protein n=1 Tax=Vairimorpha necatrix TaxID=6039 RepID=A0AAX4JBP6_9MICR